MTTPVDIRNAMAKNGGIFRLGTDPIIPAAGKSSTPNDPKFSGFIAGPGGCTIASITAPNVDGASDLIGLTFPAGQGFPMEITAMTLTNSTDSVYCPYA